jgi:uncharacterized phage-associated protein
MSYDVRAIANAVLERASECGIKVTNLSINKILYFVHGHFLAHFSFPLIREPVEAWEFGPVFPEIYRQFREFERTPIKERTKRLDVSSGRMVPFEERIPLEELDRIAPIIDFYLKLPAWKLVELSHEPGSPWHRIWNYSTSSNPGMVIPNEIIDNYFKCEWKYRKGVTLV